VVDWLKAFRTLKGTTMLVMTGTGMLSDFGIGPLDLHYGNPQVGHPRESTGL